MKIRFEFDAFLAPNVFLAHYIHCGMAGLSCQYLVMYHQKVHNHLATLISR